MIDYTVAIVDRECIKEFLEKHHYSHNINGVMSKFCFGLFSGDSLIGAAIYGNLGMANAWKKYSDNPEDVIELRRLALIDDTKKNAESYFIAKTIKWLKKNTDIKRIVSYADCNQGHVGTIYKASNFKLIGQTAKGRVIVFDGKKYHDKAIRTKYKGELKPFAKKLLERLNSGEAFYLEQKPKNIYLYELR